MKNRIACVSLVLCLICVFLLGCATAGEIEYLKVRGLPFQATWMLYFWQGRGATVLPYMFPLVHWKREIPMEHGRMRHPLPLLQMWLTIPVILLHKRTMPVVAMKGIPTGL